MSFVNSVVYLCNRFTTTFAFISVMRLYVPVADFAALGESATVDLQMAPPVY